MKKGFLVKKKNSGENSFLVNKFFGKKAFFGEVFVFEISFW